MSLRRKAARPVAQSLFEVAAVEEVLLELPRSLRSPLRGPFIGPLRGKVLIQSPWLRRKTWKQEGTRPTFS